ncbi:hypothetical protein F7D95_16110 [Prevotella copri]|uniref:Portal protein n=1 Tax=Segatella copri TaxID=165179 RepID=A0AA90UHW2_9BACT|nr:hypothetical protein [Segatella copri]MQN14278.1 hypothetical protein [Segatella copri]
MVKAKLLTLSKVMPQRNRYNSVKARKRRQAHGKDWELLTRCKNAWNNLSGVRETRARTMRYCMGDQWSDTIRVYHHGYWEEMSERTYMEKRNQTPMSNNIMISILESIAGLYAKQGTEPVCFARDNDSRQLSDMMSATMQCNWQTTGMQDLLNHLIKDYLLGGQMFVRESWEDRELEMPDAWTDAMEPDHMFFECGSDPRHNDVCLIGCLHDVSKEDLYQKFARREYGLTVNDLNCIFDIHDVDDSSYGYEFNEEKALENLSFDYTNKGRHYVRVIEVWTTETKPRLQCFDPIAKNMNNAWFRVDLEDTAMINKLIQENEKRMKQYDEYGVPEEDRAYITSEDLSDKYWYYTFMAPDGTVLCRGESPYDFKSHPYTMKLYPFINGEIHPFMTNVIDQQRYINRLIVMNDMSIRSSFKGFKMIPTTVLGGRTPEQFMEEAIEYDGWIFYTPKRTMTNVKPEIITSNAVNIGTNELLQIELNLIREVTNVSGALQGKTPSAGTSAARYAQESQNATTSLYTILSDMEIFTEKLAMKKCSVIQQFYEDGRKIFNKDGLNTYSYDRLSARDIRFKISIKNAAASTAYNTLQNDDLKELLQMGAINLIQYLQNVNKPFADKLLASVQEQQAQLEQMYQQQQGGGQVENGIVQGADQNAVAQAMSTNNQYYQTA